MCNGLNCAPCSPNLYVETLTPNVTVLGDRDFMDVTKITRSHKGGMLIQYDKSPYKKSPSPELFHSLGIHREMAT